MINVFRFMFNVFFAFCGANIGNQLNRASMFCMSFAGAFVGDLLWQVIMEVIA